MKQLIILLLLTATLYPQTGKSVLTQAQKDSIGAMISDSLSNDTGIRPYKVYTALLTQSGTDAPVATVLENTLGGAVVWTRAGAGTYVGTLAGAFPENKTFPIPSKYPISNGSNTLVVDIYRISDNQIVFFNAGSFDISALSGMDKNFAIEIRVYP